MGLMLTDAIQGGLETVLDGSLRRFIMAQAVYTNGCALLSTPATGRALIVTELKAAFTNTNQVLDFTWFKGLGVTQQWAYVWICRRALVRQRSVEATVTYPHGDIPDAHWQYVTRLGAGTFRENDIRAAAFLIEVQNQIALGEDYEDNIQDYLISLSLPADAISIYTSDAETARLTIAIVRLSSYANWNGTNNPGSATHRITNDNVKHFRKNKDFVSQIELRSWAAELDALTSTGYINDQLDRYARGNTVAWNGLPAVSKRFQDTLSRPNNDWMAWVAGHGHRQFLGFTGFAADVTPDRNAFWIERDPEDADQLLVMALVKDADAAFDSVELTVTGMVGIDVASITDDDADLDWTVDSSTLSESDGVLTIEVSSATALSASDTPKAILRLVLRDESNNHYGDDRVDGDAYMTLVAVTNDSAAVAPANAFAVGRFRYQLGLNDTTNRTTVRSTNS